MFCTTNKLNNHRIIITIIIYNLINLIWKNLLERLKYKKSKKLK